MSRAAEKILQKMRRTQAGWHAKDFDTLYIGFGFTRRGRNHAVYIHPVYTQIRDTIPRHPGELSPSYARDAVKNIDLLLSLEAAKEDEDSND